MQSKLHLLVVRLGAMGDILHALPAMTALRQAHPDWQIDWVVEPRWQALLAVPGTTERGPQMPIVDRLHFAPTKDWRKGPLSRKTIGSVSGLRRQLKAAGYDAVIDVQGAVRSSVIARMAGTIDALVIAVDAVVVAAGVAGVGGDRSLAFLGG